ncbi:MAG: Biotin carboxyl carrier protein of acetyl-CoA carboxylase [uncultured Cytophagales bacterium]|uniref:Biotin carboxyl carrier protein of acetyl-CoA carboxylase n=1 Tax=uncultured Cytophagales bacterium TaxID=158755 RepID=A0A6J4H9K9_9SPHI|nr:MAG: Biotin carboxyl carrier protein of acetyl-CoA carboxylase [uncultured Cytophagales bacterium]
MKAKEIQDLIDFIAKTGLDEVNIETEQFKLNVKRSGAGRPADSYAQPLLPPAPPPPAALPPPVAAAPPPAATAAPTPAAPVASNHHTLKSPMIGTFYRSASPESPVFAHVGDEVKKGQTLCIIEAMKLFNEIESEVSGRVVKVLVDNASPVEYDQPLFLIDPS